MRHLTSPLRLIVLALLLSVGIGALFAQAIWTLRQERWEFARRTNTNLAVALDEAIGRTVGTVDRALERVVETLRDPDAMALPPELRQRTLFGESFSMGGLGGVVVLDARGNTIYSSDPSLRAGTNLADREYFRALQGGRTTGLHIGVPVRGRFTNTLSLPLSRPYFDTDGRFAGVVVGVIRIEHFHNLFARLSLGPQSSVNLLHTNGSLVTRFPVDPSTEGRVLAGSADLRRFQSEHSGALLSTAPLDGVERLYAFRRVGDYPLIVNVAQSVDTIVASWRRGAWTLGGFAVLLMLACAGLAAMFARELGRRQLVSLQLQQAEHDMRTILDNAPSLIAYWDADLRNRFANGAHRQWHGLDPGQMRGMHLRDVFAPEQFAVLEPYLQRALAGHAQLFERTAADRHGVLRHTLSSYVPDTVGGQVRGIFIQVTDISERKRMEDELFEEKERMRLTLQAIGDAVVCTDAQGRVTYLNPMAERMAGVQAFDAAGRDVDQILPLRVSGHALDHPGPLRQALAQRGTVGPTRNVVLERPDGTRFDVQESASAIIDRNGELTGAVMVLRDVTESAETARRMEHLAQYDALTNLPNRTLLQDRAQQALAQARRGGQPLALLYLDLDGFKQVNDRLGHGAGDLLLVQFARRLKAATRASDTVSRQGGDEFVLLLPGVHEADQLAQVAAKLLAACEPPFALQGQQVQLGLSGGIALFPEHGDNLETLARHADAALYAAKRQGRGQFCLYATDGQHLPVGGGPGGLGESL